MKVRSNQKLCWHCENAYKKQVTQQGERKIDLDKYGKVGGRDQHGVQTNNIGSSGVGGSGTGSELSRSYIVIVQADVRVPGYST